MSLGSQETFQRMLVETVVRWSLRDMRKNPRRSLQMLIDLGKESASGPEQMELLETAQLILQRDDSPYYATVRDVLEKADQEKLISFGLNYAWNSLVLGARQRQKYEKVNQCKIPPGLSLQLSAGAGALGQDVYGRLVKDGTQAGIYSYFLFPDESPSIKLVFSLLEAGKDCAFFLFLPGGISARQLEALSRYSHLLFLVNSAEPNWRASVDLLRESGCLYAVYQTFATAQETQRIVSGQWADALMPFAGPAALCVAGAACPAAYREQVLNYAKSIRKKQRYPFLVVDFGGEILRAGMQNEQARHAVAVRPDGAMCELLEDREVSLGISLADGPFPQIIQRLAAKQV